MQEKGHPDTNYMIILDVQCNKLVLDFLTKIRFSDVQFNKLLDYLTKSHDLITKLGWLWTKPDCFSR